MRRLVVATRNPGKAREVAQALSDLPLEIVSLESYPAAPEVEETGSTFTENASLKARAYADFTGELTLADDSGLVVDALDGAPGVYSSRFAPDDLERNLRLLKQLEHVPDEARTARFVCAIAVAEPGGRVWTCEGTVEGLIARAMRGSHGFGYDPIFYLPELGKHMAELAPEQKNAISHRGKALACAREFLELRC